MPDAPKPAGIKPITNAEIAALKAATQDKPLWLAVASFVARIEADAATIQGLREVLHDFMANPKFHVQIGGNPIMVDGLLNRARALLWERGE